MISWKQMDVTSSPFECFLKLRCQSSDHIVLWNKIYFIQIQIIFSMISLSHCVISHLMHVFGQLYGCVDLQGCSHLFTSTQTFPYSPSLPHTTPKLYFYSHSIKVIRRHHEHQLQCKIDLREVLGLARGLPLPSFTFSYFHTSSPAHKTPFLPSKGSRNPSGSKIGPVVAIQDLLQQPLVVGMQNCFPQLFSLHTLTLAQLG